MGLAPVSTCPRRGAGGGGGGSNTRCGRRFRARMCPGAARNDCCIRIPASEAVRLLQVSEAARPIKWQRATLLYSTDTR